jgi:YD repeat-containing protein
MDTMKRRHQILAGVLAVQIILSVIVFWPGRTGAAVSHPLFPNLTADDITTLTITDADRNKIALRRVTGEWVLPETDDYPVLADRVTTMAEKILALTTSRLVTRTDASQKQLQVASDDFQRRIEFTTADGKSYILYLGSSPRYGATHFRVGGQSETYLTGDLTVWDVNATASSWVDTAYVNIQLTDLTQATLENANGVFVFVKEGDNWTMEGLSEDETLAETRVTAALRQAAVLNMTAPLGKAERPDYGMDAPQAVVTLTTSDGRTVTLTVGAKGEDGSSYVVRSSESPYYVQVAEFSVQNLVQNDRADFIEVPPTPAPTS